MRIIVAGVISLSPYAPGFAWNFLQLAVGLQKLGHDVYYVEDVEPAWCVDADGQPCPLEASINRGLFESTMGYFGFRERACQIYDRGKASFGLPLATLLARGEIDALIGSRKPEILGRDPSVARLFPNYRALERELYETHKIFPIMHLVVIRRDVNDRDPSIAQSLYQGFVDDKKLALARMHKGHPFMLPWVHDDIHEIDDVFGGDPYAYGIEANRPTLTALVQYLAEQHFIPKAMPSEELLAMLFHSRIWRQASVSTQLPSGTIMPVSSAVGMKLAGCSRPRSGWFQRTSASKPIRRRSRSAQIGWYSRKIWPAPSALRRSFSSLSWVETCWCRLASKIAYCALPFDFAL